MPFRVGLPSASVEPGQIGITTDAIGVPQPESLRMERDHPAIEWLCLAVPPLRHQIESEVVEASRQIGS